MSYNLTRLFIKRVGKNTTGRQVSAAKMQHFFSNPALDFYVLS